MNQGKSPPHEGVRKRLSNGRRHSSTAISVGVGTRMGALDSDLGWTSAAIHWDRQPKGNWSGRSCRRHGGDVSSLGTGNSNYCSGRGDHLAASFVFAGQFRSQSALFCVDLCERVKPAVSCRILLGSPLGSTRISWALEFQPPNSKRRRRIWCAEDNLGTLAWPCTVPGHAASGADRRECGCPACPAIRQR